jgi:hypothetical protein
MSLPKKLLYIHTIEKKNSHSTCESRVQRDECNGATTALDVKRRKGCHGATTALDFRADRWKARKTQSVVMKRMALKSAMDNHSTQLKGRKVPWATKALSKVDVGVGDQQRLIAVVAD